VGVFFFIPALHFCRNIDYIYIAENKTKTNEKDTVSVLPDPVCVRFLFQIHARLEP
jgi:hypothetical protein